MGVPRQLANNEMGSSRSLQFSMPTLVRAFEGCSSRVDRKTKTATLQIPVPRSRIRHAQLAAELFQQDAIFLLEAFDNRWLLAVHPPQRWQQQELKVNCHGSMEFSKTLRLNLRDAWAEFFWPYRVARGVLRRGRSHPWRTFTWAPILLPNALAAVASHGKSATRLF